MAIQFNNIAAPNFKDSNELMKSGAESYQNAIKGLGDAVKTVQTDVRSRANAELTNYLSMAQTPEEFNDPDFKAGYEQLKNSLIEYDAPLAAKELDARPDLLQDRVAKGLSNINAQNIINREPTTAAQGVATLASTITNNEVAQYGLDTAKNNQAIQGSTRAVITALQAGNVALANELISKGDVDFKAIQDYQANDQTYQFNKERNPFLIKGAQLSNENITVGIDKSKAEIAALKNNLVYGDAQVDEFKGNNPQIDNPTYKEDVGRVTNPRFTQIAKQYEGVIRDAANTNGVPLEIAMAVLGTENSGGKQNPTSTTGVKGLYQVTQATFDEMMGTKGGNRESPELSARAGIKYLGILYKKFNGDPLKTMVAYNNGAGEDSSGRGVGRAVRLATAAGNPNNWVNYLNEEGKTYAKRASNILNYYSSGNDGSALVGLPDSKNVAGSGKNGASPTQLEAAYKNSPQGLVANYFKTQSDTANKNLTAKIPEVKSSYTGPLDWLTKMKDSGSNAQVTNMLDVTGKFIPKNASAGFLEKFNKDGVKGWDQLNDSQKAAALEMSYNKMENQSWFNLRDRVVTESDLIKYQTTIQSVVNGMVEPYSKANLARRDADTKSTYNTLVSKHKFSPEQAVAALKLSPEDVTRTGILKSTGVSLNTSAALPTPIQTAIDDAIAKAAAKNKG